MRTLGIKPDQVIEQFIVEQIHVGEQQIFMVGREFVLKTAVKTFDMGVHLWCLGIGQPATYPVLRPLGIESGFEFAAIIRQYPFYFVRETRLGEPPQYGSAFAALVGAGDRQRKTAIDVGEGADVSPLSVTLYFNSVHARHTVQDRSL